MPVYKSIWELIIKCNKKPAVLGAGWSGTGKVIGGEYLEQIYQLDPSWRYVR